MMRILSGIVVTLSASPALSLLAKATLVAAAGLIGAWFAGRSRAAVRHAVLASTFSVLLALPIVSFLATPVAIAVPVAKSTSNILPLFDDLSVPSSGEPSAIHPGAATAKSGRVLPPLSTILLYGWLLGTGIFAIQIIRGLLQIRSLRRFGLPWRHGQAIAEDLAPRGRRVEILLHESLPGPLTCGVLNPVIILPADAQTWNEKDLERALVHELEHIRRSDWAIHCFARVACATYWFHPLIWTAWRHLTLEAERSCDDAVLRNSEATAYADQLLGLARRRSVVRRSPALAMAGRSDLAARISALLDRSQRRGPIGTLLVAATCVAAAAIILTMSPLQMVAAPQETSPEFDVASIRRDVSGEPGGMFTLMPVCHLERMTLKDLVIFAYRVHGFEVTGGPVWIDSDRYNIEARTGGSPSSDPKYVTLQYRRLQTLLRDRFNLTIHRETKELPVYELAVAKGGPKLHTPNCLHREPGDFTIAPGKYCGLIGGSMASGRLQASSTTMPNLAHFLSSMLSRTVIDKTGITGEFDLQFSFTPERPAFPAPEAVTDLGPDFFTSLEEQAGLKLKSAKGPVEMLVIDHAERPSEN